MAWGINRSDEVKNKPVYRKDGSTVDIKPDYSAQPPKKPKHSKSKDITSFPADLGRNGEETMWMKYEFMEHTSPSQGAKQKGGFAFVPSIGVNTKRLWTCALPHNQSIEVNSGQQWNTDDSDLKSNLLGGLKNVENTWGSVFDAAGSAISSGVQAATNASASFSGTTNSQGSSIIKNKALNYMGPDQREFSTTHTMVPRNRKEWEAIQDIVYSFRFFAAPAGPQNSSGSMTYTFPDLCKLTYMRGSEKREDISQFDIAYITNVTVTYGDDTFKAFHDGSPIQTTITLGFTEMTFQTKQHIEAFR
jgi:hypothetical protein